MRDRLTWCLISYMFYALQISAIYFDCTNWPRYSFILCGAFNAVDALLCAPCVSTIIIILLLDKIAINGSILLHFYMFNLDQLRFRWCRWFVWMESDGVLCNTKQLSNSVKYTSMLLFSVPEQDRAYIWVTGWINWYRSYELTRNDLGVKHIKKQQTRCNLPHLLLY